MRQMLKIAAAGLSAALLATACGSTGANVLKGKTPEQMIQLASSKVTGESYHMTMDAKMAVDASGVQGMPSSMLDAMTTAMKGFSMKGDGDVQNAQRVKMTMQISTGGIDKTMAMVLYDGEYLISLDNDGRYADAGSLNLQGVNASPDQIKSLLIGAVDVKDEGTTVHDGVSVEHLHANLGPDYLKQQLDRMSGASGSGAMAGAMQQLAQLLKDVFSVRNGTLDVYVRTLDGRVEAVDTGMTMAIDMAKFMTLLEQQYGGQLGGSSGLGDVTGSMVMNITGENRFSNYGAKITVSKPTVDPNAPSLPSNLFGG